MEIKDFLKKAQKSAGNGFAFSKIWKMQAQMDLAENLGLSVLEDAKKIRRILRKIRDAQISAVVSKNCKDSDLKEFLEFMETFLESGITNFKVESLLSGATISAAEKGDEKAKLEVKRAEQALKKVEDYLNKNKKK